jgi:uncharacterized SAM-binding protein YcdF (DUF218 family)
LFRWLLLISGLLALLLSAAFFFPQQILCVDGGNVQADAIVVLGGGFYERPKHAAELFRSGAAPRIIVSGAGDCASNQQILVTGGVPPGAITLEPQSRSTKENAQFCIPLLRDLGAKRVIIVTSWYHSRRGLHAFEHYAPDLQFYSRPTYYAYPRAEWSRAGISGYIRAEYVKLAGYWVCYGVCPF